LVFAGEELVRILDLHLTTVALQFFIWEVQVFVQQRRDEPLRRIELVIISHVWNCQAAAMKGVACAHHQIIVLRVEAEFFFMGWAYCFLVLLSVPCQCRGLEILRGDLGAKPFVCGHLMH